MESSKTKIKLRKPFLKWVGGKTQIIDKIMNKLPCKMENYHELFLGGGSVLLAVLTLQKHTKISIKNKVYAYDLNLGLINTFKQIQYNYKRVITEINILIKEFKSIKINTVGQRGAPKNIDESNYKTTREHYYYWIRSKFNACDKTTLESAVYFIFLNKTSFRGMYREGKNGIYNIPYGLKDKKSIPAIIHESEIEKISILIQNVEFIHSDFSDSIKNVGNGDYVYLDPPYAPENSKSFVGYTKNGFNGNIHKKLFDEILKLDKKNIKFSMSNAKVDLVMNYFKNFKCDDIIARRAINSKNPGSTAKEVLVSN